MVVRTVIAAAVLGQKSQSEPGPAEPHTGQGGPAPESYHVSRCCPLAAGGRGHGYGSAAIAW